MKKIFFYSPSLFIDSGRYINITPVFLDSYLKDTYPELLPHIEWTKTCCVTLDRETLRQEIVNNDIDILALGIYVWNEKEIYSLIDNLKFDLNKELIIIAGGPSVIPNIDRDYLSSHPDIDYAIFAQGEKAFLNVLKHIIFKSPLNKLDSTNLAWKQNGNTHVANFEFLKLDRQSPYINSCDLLQKILDEAKDLKEFKGVNPILPYATSKGCPYKCSFCAWGEGHTKVFHRKFPVEKEIDLIGSLGISVLDIIDANFGQHKQDYQTIAAIAKLNSEKKYNIQISVMSLSKLNWDANINIIRLMCEHNIPNNPLISIQDLDPTVLKNIDRPGPNWEELKPKLKTLKKEYPTLSYRLELIVGLPGQTRESWQKTLLDINNVADVPQVYYWVQLPGSPAYQQSYIDTMQLVVKDVWFDQKAYPTVIGSYSYDLNDWIYFQILSGVVIGLKPFYCLPNRRKLINDIHNSPRLNNAISELTEAVFEKDWEDLKKQSIKNFTLQFLNDSPEYKAQINAKDLITALNSLR